MRVQQRSVLFKQVVVTLAVLLAGCDLADIDSSTPEEGEDVPYAEAPLEWDGCNAGGGAEDPWDHRMDGLHDLFYGYANTNHWTVDLYVTDRQLQWLEAAGFTAMADVLRLPAPPPAKAILVVSWAVVEIIKQLWLREKQESINLPWSGTPGETVYSDTVDGQPKQARRYGPDGYPEVDVDYDHSHGDLGQPHAHDVGRPADGSPPTTADRVARPVRPGDPVHPKAN